MAACPRCRGTTVQLLSQLFEREDGYYTTGGSSETFGMNITTGDVFIAHTSSLQIHRNYSINAPPPRMRVSWPFAIITFSVIFFGVPMFLSGFYLGILNIVVGSAMTFGGMLAAVRKIVRVCKYNRNQWPGLMNAWHATYRCQQCRHAFVPGSGGGR
jgi:hypothetical protein